MLVQEEFCFQPARLRGGAYVGEWKLVPVRPRPRSAFAAILDPKAAQTYWKQAVETAPDFTPEVERLVVVALNCRGVPLGHAVTSVGTVDSTIFHPREVFRAAIVASAASIVVLHNHPSGDPTPSSADMRATRALREASTLLQIPLHDHVIIGEPGIFSFRESGML
ncbi:MAG: JAB domain-containing protein [Verrucomicrobiota bacterium]